ncbi:ribonuclease J [Idiomarina baltica]|uniref:ribonuclease J n=1 Tax=Idiomarina baltica TaxID=190892 RepID=UPI000C3FB9FC|nr:ribonuclease J [Idiomarina baltica]MBL74957.1 MBL fold metallo-hydrolase [Idiomarinaceae bacterium]
MNMNLYGHAGRWLMIDCGVSFDEPLNPAKPNSLKHEVVCADPRFITDNKDELEAIIITHAHEDHIGAIEDLWLRWQKPIYTTPYTAAVLRKKLAYTAFAELVSIIETPAARVLHTGDWKIDAQPITSAGFDSGVFQRLGLTGIDAVVGDSTNAMKPGWSTSEADCHDGLLAEVKEAQGRVVVGCFSSNIARLITLARVAEASGRYLAVLGRSLERNVGLARQFGLWPEHIELIDHTHVGYLPAREVLVVATGCQGESRAALNRLADDSHPHLVLDKGDKVIMSAIIIPGNELDIQRLTNKFKARRIEVVHAEQSDRILHASGHPNQEELKQLYQWVKPRMVIPTHGGPDHMKAHAEVAKKAGVRMTLTGMNGDLFKIGLQPSVRRNAVKAGRIALARD